MQDVENWDAYACMFVHITFSQLYFSLSVAQHFPLLHILHLNFLVIAVFFSYVKVKLLCSVLCAISLLSSCLWKYCSGSIQTSV